MNIPFKQLDYFEAADEKDYAGREGDIEALIALVLSSRTTVLYGRSGLGKTSLLRAGVFPRLKAQGFRCAYVRILDSPLRDLSAALREQFPHEFESTAQGATDETAGTDLLRLAGRVSSGNGQAEKYDALLVVFDQFEEFFTIFRDQPQKRYAFVREIDAIVRARHEIRFMFSLREDYLYALDDFQRLWPDLFTNSYRLLPLTAFGARSALVTPLRTRDIVYDDGLITALLDALARHEFDSARLQLAAAEVFHRVEAGQANGTAPPVDGFVLGRDAVEEVRSNVGNGLFRRYLDRAAKQIPFEMQMDARTILDLLITENETKLARTREDLLQLGFAREAVIDSVLQELEKARLIRETDQQGRRFFELRHECLIREIREWQKQHADFAEYLTARDAIRRYGRDDEFQRRPTLLLSADMLARAVSPNISRFRLSVLEAEFVLWSAIRHRSDDLPAWAAEWVKLAKQPLTGLLTRMLAHPDPEIQEAAAIAVGIVAANDEELVGLCLGFLSDGETKSMKVRLAALESVAKVMHTSDPLRERCLATCLAVVRKEAGDGKIGGEALAQVAKLAQDRKDGEVLGRVADLVRETAIPAGQRGPRSAQAMLAVVQGLGFAPALREFCLQLVIGGAAGEQPMEARIMALHGIGDVLAEPKSEEPVTALVNLILSQKSRSDHEELQRKAAAIFAEHAGPQAIRILRRHLGWANWLNPSAKARELLAALQGAARTRAKQGAAQPGSPQEKAWRQLGWRYRRIAKKEWEKREVERQQSMYESLLEGSISHATYVTVACVFLFIAPAIWLMTWLDLDPVIQNPFFEIGIPVIAGILAGLTSLSVAAAGAKASLLGEDWRSATRRSKWLFWFSLVFFPGALLVGLFLLLNLGSISPEYWPQLLMTFAEERLGIHFESFQAWSVITLVILTAGMLAAVGSLGRRMLGALVAGGRRLFHGGTTRLQAVGWSLVFTGFVSVVVPLGLSWLNQVNWPEFGERAHYPLLLAGLILGSILLSALATLGKSAMKPGTAAAGPVPPVTRLLRLVYSTGALLILPWLFWVHDGGGLLHLLPFSSASVDNKQASRSISFRAWPSTDRFRIKSDRPLILTAISRYGALISIDRQELPNGIALMWIPDRSATVAVRNESGGQELGPVGIELSATRSIAPGAELSLSPHKPVVGTVMFPPSTRAPDSGKDDLATINLKLVVDPGVQTDKTAWACEISLDPSCLRIERPGVEGPGAGQDPLRLWVLEPTSDPKIFEPRMGPEVRQGPAKMMGLYNQPIGETGRIELERGQTSIQLQLRGGSRFTQAELALILRLVPSQLGDSRRQAEALLSESQRPGNEHDYLAEARADLLLGDLEGVNTLLNSYQGLRQNETEFQWEYFALRGFAAFRSHNYAAAIEPLKRAKEMRDKGRSGTGIYPFTPGFDDLVDLQLAYAELQERVRLAPLEQKTFKK